MCTIHWWSWEENRLSKMKKNKGFSSTDTGNRRNCCPCTSERKHNSAGKDESRAFVRDRGGVNSETVLLLLQFRQGEWWGSASLKEDRRRRGQQYCYCSSNRIILKGQRRRLVCFYVPERPESQSINEIKCNVQKANGIYWKIVSCS